MSRGPRPLAGSLSSGEHEVLPFRGWLELVAAIEQARLATHGEANDER
jgi:hypothetical protein